MTVRPQDFTDSVSFIGAPHTKSCRLEIADECVCLWINSRPVLCPSCEDYQASAHRCKACRIIAAGRKAYVAEARRMMRKRSQRTVTRGVK